jgi:hypothetical protein
VTEPLTVLKGKHTVVFHPREPLAATPTAGEVLVKNKPRRSNNAEKIGVVKARKVINNGTK